MNILVLQLARLGDVLQTLPAIQALKKAHSGSRITLVVRKTFADAARISPHVDKLVEFSSAEILGPAILDPSAEGKRTSAANLEAWLRENFSVGDAPFDLSINLTFTPATAMMSALIPAKERRGVSATAEGEIVIADLWSQYFFAQVLEKNLNILHLNDLFSRIAGVKKGGWPLEIAKLDSPAAPAPKTKDRIRLGVQVAASQSQKTMSAKAWAETCGMILSKTPEVDMVFFGSAEDRATLETISRELVSSMGQEIESRLTCLAGTMRFHENVPWVQSCDWILSPDTAMVHLASICGTRVLELVLGGVKPEETGPYGEGHQILYPMNVNAAQLGEELSRILRGKTARPRVAQVSTRLAACSDGSFRNDHVPKNFTPDEVTNFFMKGYYLLAEFRCSGAQEDIEIPPLGDPAQKGALDRLINVYDALCTAARLAEFGQHYCLKMLSALNEKESLKSWMEKLAEVERLAMELKKTVPFIKPLIDTWVVAKDISYAPATQVSASSGLESMIVVAEGAYRELGQNIEIVKQLLHTAVKAAQDREKPKSKGKEALGSVGDKPKERDLDT